MKNKYGLANRNHIQLSSLHTNLPVVWTNIFKEENYSSIKEISIARGQVGGKAQTLNMTNEPGRVPFTFCFIQDFKENPIVKRASIYLLSTCHIQDAQLTEVSQQPFELVASLALLSRKEIKGKRSNTPQVTKSTKCKRKTWTHEVLLQNQCCYPFYYTVSEKVSFSM